MLLTRTTAVLVLLLVSTLSFADSHVSTERGRAFDTYLTRQEAYGFSSAVLVAKYGQVLLCKGYGVADREHDAKVDEHTRFNLASLTKAFTATLILRLEQDGVLNRNDTIATQLPGVPDDKRAITIEQLLTHTSGLPWDAVPRGENLSRDDVRRRILNAKLISRPGERFSYSNAGYQLLALIAETETGRTHGDLLRDFVFSPAKMKDSGIVADEEAGTNIARGYNEWSDLGTWRDWHDGWRHGSGDVVSSVEDVYRWHTALRSGELIDAARVRDMFATHVSANNESYGYGWFTQRATGGDSLVAHGGDNKGYHTDLHWFVDRDLLVIVLTNVEIYDESGEGLALHKRIITNALSRLARGETVPLPPEPARVRADDLQRYVGVHAIEGGHGATITIALDRGRLTASADGQAAINSLLNLDDPGLDACNGKSEVLLRAVAARDTAAVRVTLGRNAPYFLVYELEQRGAEEQRLGAFLGADVLGTKPHPWDPELRRTFARLRFERGAIDYQYTWDRDSFYESISETGAPHPVILPLVPVGGDELVAWDIVALRGARLGFTRENGVWRLSSIKPVSL